MRIFFALLVLAAAASADEFDSDGARIHYDVSGKGEPVILIHWPYAGAKMK